MADKKLEFETIDQLQAVFGTQDHLVRLIERAFNVNINFHGSEIEVRGDAPAGVEGAAAVMDAMRDIYDQGENIDDEMVYRLIEETADGDPGETSRAMGDVVAVTYKGAPVRCKTPGQKNYIKALRDNTVTLCIGPAGTGKTYLAVAQAVNELKAGEIERIIMSRPAIEAGEERLGFLPGDLAQKVDPYLRPLYDALYDMYGSEKADRLREKGP